MSQWTLFLQAYVEADDYEPALSVAGALIRALQGRVAVADCHVSPYGKFENQYGVWLALEAEDKPEAWRDLQTVLATDWHVGGDDTDRHAIWDGRTGGPSPVTEARWLNLELYATGEPDEAG